jgi:hypothetical protein
MTSNEDIDTLHRKLVDQVADDISECLDGGEELNLTPGEAIGICTATLIDAVVHLAVVSQTPEHVFMTWCHDHYRAVRDVQRGSQQ